MSVTPPPLAEGQILGDRYRIRMLLGRGGMGEVFRAFDLKLRVDVALKAVRPTLLTDERALAGLRQEVRAAREIVSPNVCRVFDLVEFDGRELVSMEYVDGVTLADVLRERSPLDLQEARDIAAQFLAGLDAIHGAGLVHRDIKPENVMLTRAGRVVVMDFGITRAASESRVRTVAGTPAYMAPEQARGDAVDARADVFSAGVVLAELVAPAGARNQAAREAVWRGIHDEPQRLDDTPWAAVLRKAVARSRDQRYSTAAALSRALDEVTLRTTGDESLRPYPGLAAFTERDAGFFVGRELEIEAMWKKLRRPHLQALIGPSGAGKSSFLRAGLGASAPPGWRVVFATPSHRPFAALAHALAPELAGDAEAVARLIDFEQPGVAIDVVTRWRRRHDHALLVLDQFEELFTQSADEVQQRFAELLARARAGSGCPRPAVDARRLPLPLPAVREPRAGVLRADGDRSAHRRGAAARAGPARPQVRLSLRRRGDGGRDARRGVRRARRAAAGRVRHVAAVGVARPRARTAHAGCVPRPSAASPARSRSMPKRRLDAHRPGARADRARAAAQPGHRAGHPGHARPRRAAVGVRRRHTTAGRRRARRVGRCQAADMRTKRNRWSATPLAAAGSRSCTSRS